MHTYINRPAAALALAALACGPASSSTGDTDDTATEPGTTADASSTTDPGPTTDTTSEPEPTDSDPTVDPTVDPTIDPTTESEPPPEPCAVEVVPGDHAAATCSGGPCPISADVELRCGEYHFASPGLRVAATPDAMWVATASESDSMLYRVTPDAATERVTLSARFARQHIHLATGPAGDLHVAAEVAINAEGDNGVAYLSEADSFAEQTLHEGNAGAPLAGFQVEADGRPHVWHFGDGPDDYRELVGDGQGKWTSTGVAVAPGGYGTPKFGRDAQGRLLAADMREDGDLYWLGVEVDGALVLLGEKLNSPSNWQHYVLAASASPKPPQGPPFAGLIERPNGVEIVWPVADGDGSDGVDVPALTVLKPQCFGDSIGEDEECGPPCTDIAAGYEFGTPTLARGPDGRAWVVVVTTQLAVDYSYTKICMEEIGCFCEPNVDSDASTSVVHLFRVALDGSDPVEVLTLPIPRLDLFDAFSPFADNHVGTHAHVFDHWLAIGLRVRSPVPGQAAVRAFRVDLDALAP